MPKQTLFLFIFLVAISIIGCQPLPFTENNQHYEFDYCRSYQEAWSTTREVFLSHEYQLLGAFKDDGFLRTEWLYKDYPSLGVSVRSRFNANFLPLRPVVRITPEVEFLVGGPLRHKEIPVVHDVLRELDERLRCVGDELPPRSQGKPPATK